MNKWPAKKLGEPVSFDVIVHSWLKDEWYKPEFDKMKGNISDHLIMNPDFLNLNDNKLRYGLLYSVRRPMIETIPTDTCWFKIQIERNDLNRIFHCPCLDWQDITNGRFHVFESIKNVDSQNGHSRIIREIISSLDGKCCVNGLVLVASSPESAFTIIEGNHRFVASVSVASHNGFNELNSETSYLGLSQQMKEFKWHIEKYIL